MGRDVFISYSKHDVETAKSVSSYMERRGITCWIAPRDVGPGEEFAKAILDAIDDSGAVVLILSNSSNASRFVRSEVDRAFAKEKTIFTLRTEDVVPSRQLELYLAPQQWLDGFPPPLEEKLDPPTGFVKLSDRQCWQFELVCQKDEALSCIRIEITDAPKRLRIFFAG